MSVILGVAGAKRNAAVALCDGGRVVAVCERERLTRTRRASLRAGQLPLETLDTTLRIAGRNQSDISAYAIAEPGIELPPDLHVERVDHHYAHAATSFYTSPFDDAVVLVCDRHGIPDLTIWRGDGAGLRRLDFSWVGPGFATVYSQLAEALGFAAEGDEHRVQALAHVAPRTSLPASPQIAYRGDRLEVSPRFKAAVASLLASNGHEHAVVQAASVAERLQRSLGDHLLELTAEMKRSFGGHNLCLAGGLFFNSYFNTVLAESGAYERVFVPVNPGNAGVSLGAALGVAERERPRRPDAPLSAFLGPGYGSDDVKAILDNCKLSYDYARNGQLIERTVTALAKGKLVGWFQGRMEWGPRALGNRSILASPVAPYVLENLNRFLKQREPYRSYSVSICAEDVARYFRGPATSLFMEYEYEVLEPDLLRSLLPLGATRLRVQTVPESSGTFHTLIKAFGEVTGVPILVNTSFNGFNEPIVCTPRDAVRVFYGTGLDMAAIDSFVLQK
jgi:carbamoyltransferase